MEIINGVAIDPLPDHGVVLSYPADQAPSDEVLARIHKVLHSAEIPPEEQVLLIKNILLEIQ